MANTKTIIIKGSEIKLLSHNNSDYISLTDMAKSADGNEQLVYNWMRTKFTIEFLGIWESVQNPKFKPLEFERFKNEAGSNTFLMTPKKWIDSTDAIGIVSKSGRYGGGTYAHEDIALEFGTWLSAAFKIYLIQEVQRLKKEEQAAKGLKWDLRRELAKINYTIHTDAVKGYLVPPRLLNTQMEGSVYANEADMLNLALFGKTAREWKANMPDAEGNMRDNATAEQLLVLANLENLNAEFIKQGLKAEDRLQRLNEIAIYQMKLLTTVHNKMLNKVDIDKRLGN
jgi:hypothetical protein